MRLLNIVGVDSGQFGTKIFIVAKNNVVRTLNVAEACSGLRSLMTFVAIAATVAFLSFRPLWQKIVMVASAVPIAILCNTLRVTMQGFLARHSDAQWAEGFAHGFVGLAMMIPAFFLIILVGWILQNSVIEEVNDKDALRAAGAGGGDRSNSRTPDKTNRNIKTIARNTAARVTSSDNANGEAAVPS